MAYKPSLLWEIESCKGFKSFIFGSIHVSGLNLEHLKSTLTNYIRACNYCAIEICLDHALAIDLSSYQMLNKNDSHLNYISEKIWSRVTHQLNFHYNFDLNAVASLKPLLILNLVIQQSCNKPGEEILDEWIWNYAKTEFKVMKGLESINEHYEVLNSITLLSQYRMFCESLENIPKFKRKLLSLLLSYKAQDIRSLYNQVKCSAGDAKHKLLTIRNFTMSEQLEKYMLEQPTFAVVGAGHIYGKSGLLNLVKKRNFKVRPIKVNL